MPRHQESKIVPYRASDLFDLVMDIEKYPQFVPWCVSAKVLEKHDNYTLARMAIGYKIYRESFLSKVHTKKPNEINVEYQDGPFKYLNNTWRLTDVQGQGTKIDFAVDFEFRSKILQTAIQPVFFLAVQRMVKSFEERAQKLLLPVCK